MVKIGTVDPLSLLERKDKWFLGGGKGAIYAPPFPRWLETPGFWDESYLADIRLTRLFTVLFCDSSGRPVKLKGEFISWRPDRMILEHRSSSHVIRETRLVTENNEWVSVIELVSGSRLSAFVWSLPEMREPGHGTPWQSLSACEVCDESISYEFATAWPAELEPDRTGIDAEQIPNRATEQSSNPAVPDMLPPLTLKITISADQPRISHTVNLAQRHDDAPLWETSLLSQKLKDGALPRDFKLFVGPPPVEGLIHILQQYEVEPGEPLVVSCRAEVKQTDDESSIENRGSSIGPEVIHQNERAWRNYFASVPQFSSSDPYLTNAYWYRWYGLRLNTVDLPNLPISGRNIGFQPMGTAAFQVVGVHGQDGHGTHRLEADATFSPFITEGVGFFRNFVTYSAQAHLREVAWMHSPRLAVGILENLAKCQREDGSFPGHNYSCRPSRDFYHADYATGLDQLQKLHPDACPLIGRDFLDRYCGYLIQHREIGVGRIKTASKLLEGAFAVFDQNETGQEYMSRYQFASAGADQWGKFVVAGVDATSYAARLLSYLNNCEVPSEIFPLDASWNLIDEEIGAYSALHKHFYAQAKFFTDMSLDGQRSDARPACGFYPLLAFPHSSMHSGSGQTKVLTRWLLNPDEFWLPKGFPATALSDPTFSADAEWRDKRLNCPWNGRSWPMVNSHLVDATANVARNSPSSISRTPDIDHQPTSSEMEEGVGGGGSADLDLRVKAGEALMKAVTLMFHEDDPARPNSYEHYDPFTGTPSLYRGYDDYMHSWIVDLIMRHAVGVKPGEDDVDPLPLGVDWIDCTDIPHPRGRMHVRIEKDVVVRCEVTDS